MVEVGIRIIVFAMFGAFCAGYIAMRYVAIPIFTSLVFAFGYLILYLLNVNKATVKRVPFRFIKSMARAWRDGFFMNNGYGTITKVKWGCYEWVPPFKYHKIEPRR